MQTTWWDGQAWRLSDNSSATCLKDWFDYIPSDGVLLRFSMNEHVASEGDVTGMRSLCYRTASRSNRHISFMLLLLLFDLGYQFDCNVFLQRKMQRRIQYYRHEDGAIGMATMVDLVATPWIIQLRTGVSPWRSWIVPTNYGFFSVFLFNE